MFSRPTSAATEGASTLRHSLDLCQPVVVELVLVLVQLVGPRNTVTIDDSLVLVHRVFARSLMMPGIRYLVARGPLAQDNTPRFREIHIQLQLGLQYGT
jgi:hypothetical protein